MTGRTLGMWVAIAIAAVGFSTLAHAEFTMSGYTQVDYAIHEDSDGDQFDIRRARLKGKGKLNDEGTTAVVQIDLSKLDNDGGDVVLKDAYVSHPFSEEWSVRVGLSAHPLGHEVEYSSSRRPWMERSMGAKEFAPGEQDLGIYLTRQSRGDWNPEFVVGYSNGMDKWHKKGAPDADSFLVRADFPFGNGSFVGATWRSASQDDQIATAAKQAAAELDEDCFNLHLVFNANADLSLWGEYYDGQVNGIDADAWYVGLVHDLPESDVTVFYRYDQYSETGADDYDRHVIGGYWELATNQRITLEIDSYDDGGDDATDVLFRWQFKYK